jgi:UDP-N-acetylmuramyl-tripeptide synthetase
MMKCLEDIWTHVEGITAAGADAAQVEVRGIAYDSREITEGMLFVALTGSDHDGHAYVEAACERGACAVLIEAGRDVGELSIPVLRAQNTRAVLGPLAAYFYETPSRALRVVGITGTNGKTTTSFLLEQISAAAGHSTAVIGTINYRWPGVVRSAPNTTPESLVLQRLMHEMADDGVENLVMEVSSHGLATHRLEQTLFDVAVFTNLTQDHLDFHGTMEAYRDAKRQLFVDHLPRAARAGKRPVAIVNLDDREGRALAELFHGVHGVMVRTYSLDDPGADYCCVRRELNVDGARLEIRTPDGHLALNSPMLGEFNVANVLAAVAAATVLGMNSEAITLGMAASTGVPGRLERIEPGVRPAVFVDYAHTPDALERALETLRPFVEGKLVVVFGCGGQRDRDKRPQMGAIAARLADRVVLTSDNPRREDPMAIIEDILSGMPPEGDAVSVEPDRRRAIALAIEEAGPGDVVLLAGKGHENYQEVGGTRRPFDDGQEARAVLQKHEGRA